MRTSAFYGDLVQAAMGKDVKYMTELIDTLNEREIRILASALLKITMVSDLVVKVRTDEY